MDAAAFSAAFGDTFELAPWVAKGAYAKRPFTPERLFAKFAETP